jgi:large subunit ribosomal protein L13
MKTYSPKKKDVQRSWYVIDAQGAILGRLASEVAAILRGKHKPTFAPHMDMGDHVIVVNASGIRLSGEKAGQKLYRRHSQHPGGLNEIPFETMLARHPERVVEQAVRGMLPKNRLGRQMFRKLSVYPGAEHPHEAQNPAPLKLGAVPGAITTKES